MSPVLLRHHLQMLLRPRRLIGLILLASLPAVIILVVGAAGDASMAEAVPGIVATVGSTTFPVAALILAGAVLRDERDDGTLPYLYLSPLPRPALALTSIVSGIVATGLVALVAAGAIVLAGMAVGADSSAGLATVPTYLLAAAGYSALFVPLGYLVPRVILVGLGYVIVWEQIVARLVTGVANTSVWRFSLSTYVDLAGAGGGELAEALGPVTPGSWGALAKVAAVLMIGWAGLTWALRRRDAI